MPGDVTLSDTNLYRVIPGRPVEIRTTIGDAQVGGTAVTWRGSLVRMDEDSLCWRIEGNLPNTLARAVTIVQDINPATNHTAVTYHLSGGFEDEDFPYGVDVKKDKGKAHYVITFVFFAM